MLLNTTTKRDEIRRQKNKPFYVKSPWFEKELKEALNEIDRLKAELATRGLVETRLRKSWKEDTESATKKGELKCAEIEQQTKEACIKRIKQEKWLGKWDVETLEQAIDSAGG